MRSKTIIYAVAASAVFFVSGLAVGQRTSASKFDKYLGPVNRPEMDLIALEVNVNSIRNNVPTAKGIYIPEVFFNYKENRPYASVFISSTFEKESIDTVKSEISDKYYVTYFGLKSLIPELSEDDFILKVFRLATDPDRKLFAECKHGNIVFH